MSAEESHDRDLERRGAAAAADLQRVADAREVPLFDPAGAPEQIDLEPAAERRRPLLAAAAMVIVLAGGVAVWLAGPGTGDQGPADEVTSSGGFRPFLLPEPPDGYELTVFAQATLDPVAPGTPDALTLYGPSVSEAGLGVAVGSVEMSLYRGDPGEPVAVRSGTWQLHDEPRALVGQFGDREVALFSPDLSRDQLSGIAETVAIDRAGDPRIDVAALPEGWRMLRRTGTTTATTFAANYEAGKPGGLLVSSSPGDRARIAALSLMLPNPEPVTVRGGPGVLGSAPSRGGARFLAWLERPGEVLLLQAVGNNELDLRAVSERVTPISSERAAELARRSQLGDFAPDEALTEVGRGTFPDGTDWVLRHRGDEVGTPSADLGLAPASGVTGVGASGVVTANSDAALVSSTRVTTGGRAYAGGLINDEVARVEVQPAGGETRQVPIVEGGGYRGWATPVPEDGVTVIARATDGSELDRSTFRGPVDGSGSSGTPPDPATGGPGTTPEGTETAPQGTVTAPEGSATPPTVTGGGG